MSDFLAQARARRLAAAQPIDPSPPPAVTTRPSPAQELVAANERLDQVAGDCGYTIEAGLRLPRTPDTTAAELALERRGADLDAGRCLREDYSAAVAAYEAAWRAALGTGRRTP